MPVYTQTVHPHDSNTARWTNHVAGALNPYGARSWGNSERHANRRRGARRIAIGSRKLEKPFEALRRI